MIGVSEAARITSLAPNDLIRVLRLQHNISTQLPAGFLRAKSERDLYAYLDGTAGLAFGVVQQDQLLAAALLRLPSEEHPNQGLQFPHVPAVDWPRHTAFLENAMVHPSARGRGYQRLLLEARFACAAERGMRWVCAGVHFNNSTSWNNLLAQGMVIAGMRLDMGYPILGLLGTLNARGLLVNLVDQIRVAGDEHLRHQAVLQSGYVGARRAPDGAVLYQRLLSASTQAAE
ncbi:MAG: GNAT family N-acetyltransferase [Burkholderiaceae bacterium]